MSDQEGSVDPSATGCDAEASASSEDTRLPASLRRENLIEYDLARYPFPQIVHMLLDAGELQQLHTTVAAQQWLNGMVSNNARAYAVRRNAYDKRFKEIDPFKQAKPLQECYLRFLREVVAPLIEAHVPGGSSEMLYQAQPNFRCHLPGTGHLLVHRHRDADYHHQPNELNIWLPLTPCQGSNTLWSESSPGLGDYRPFELVPGQCMLFWGHQCSHYTVPNETGVTRVSIDFRVVPLSFYRPLYPNSHRRDGQPRFAKGCFFATLGERADGQQHALDGDAAAAGAPSVAAGREEEDEEEELGPELMAAIAVF